MARSTRSNATGTECRSGTDRKTVTNGNSVSSDDVFDFRSAFNAIEQNNRDTLTALIFSWIIAVNLLQLRNDDYRDRAPTRAEAKLHQSFLSNLVTVAEFIAPRIKNLAPGEQARFILERDKLLKLEGFTAAGMIAKLDAYAARQKAK